MLPANTMLLPAIIVLRFKCRLLLQCCACSPPCWRDLFWPSPSSCLEFGCRYCNDGVDTVSMRMRSGARGGRRKGKEGGGGLGGAFCTQGVRCALSTYTGYVLRAVVPTLRRGPPATKHHFDVLLFLRLPYPIHIDSQSCMVW